MNHQGWGKFIFVLMLTLGSVHYAGAFVKTGPDDELFVTGTINAEENDNLFLSHSNAKSDLTFNLTPGLDWDFGKNSTNQGSLMIGDDFQLFTSESSLDTNLPMASFSDVYDDSKTKVNLDANYQKLDQATRDVRLVGHLVKRDWTHLDATGEVSVSEKTSVSAGAIFDDTVYHQAGYDNWEWFSIPLKYYYKVEPKLDVSAGFTYQNNTVGSPGVNSDEYFYNVGARGEFTEKFTGEFSVGYEQIQFKRGSNDSGLGAISNFNYSYSPKTTFTLGLNSGYAYSPAGATAYRTSGVTGSVQSKITEQWTIGGSIGYSAYRYITTPERDNYYNAGVNLTYVVSTYVSVQGGYRYTKDDSNIVLDNFTNNIFSLGLVVKY